MPQTDRDDHRGALLSVGRTAEIFAWGDDAVVKLFRPGWPARDARAEARHGGLVRAQGLPAPRVLDLVELDGRPGIVFERLRGPSLLQELVAQPWRLRSIARAFADLHADIGTAAPADMDSLAAQLQARLTAAADLPVPVRTAALRRLDTAADGTARLCHGDFHPDNVIRTDRGLVVIDWLTAGLGDPAYDVARSRLMLSIGQPVGRMSAAQRAMITAGRRLFTAAYVRRCRQRHGWRAADIAAWDPVALAVRMAEAVDGEAPALAARLARLRSDAGGSGSGGL